MTEAIFTFAERYHQARLNRVRAEERKRYLHLLHVAEAAANSLARLQSETDSTEIRVGCMRVLKPLREAVNQGQRSVPFLPKDGGDYAA